MVQRKPSEVAAYVGELCLELQRMADEADLELLAHLLLITTPPSTRYSGGPAFHVLADRYAQISANLERIEACHSALPVCQTCRRERVVIKVDSWGGYARGTFHCRICKTIIQIVDKPRTDIGI